MGEKTAEGSECLQGGNGTGRLCLGGWKLRDPGFRAIQGKLTSEFCMSSAGQAYSSLSLLSAASSDGFPPGEERKVVAPKLELKGSKLLPAVGGAPGPMLRNLIGQFHLHTKRFWVESNLHTMRVCPQI